ncbi:hypothetical protein AVEN_160641-1 [Araneus ventricosus]|uniref:Uncharacterized protein n=1 Tax=Araneus ventricosus TaxID=182803 RepID=A0A4Y2TP13_ARAVE|nr:hypothetical protein AVEN_160641-1 [Araneus ventricosus]
MVNNRPTQEQDHRLAGERNGENTYSSWPIKLVFLSRRPCQNLHVSGKYLKRKEKEERFLIQNRRSSFAIRISRNILVSHSSSLSRIRLKIRRSAEILTTRLKGETVLMVTSSSLEKRLEKTSVLSTTDVVLRMFTVEKLLLSNHTFTKQSHLEKKSHNW